MLLNSNGLRCTRLRQIKISTSAAPPWPRAHEHVSRCRSRSVFIMCSPAFRSRVDVDQSKGEGESTLKHGRNYSNEANPETADPSSVFIRMFNPTWIEMERGQFWQMLQDIVPREEWPRTATMLACLESIYRAEFSKTAEDACTALSVAKGGVRKSGGRDSKSSSFDVVTARDVRVSSGPALDEANLMASAAADAETADRELFALMSLLLHRSHFWSLTRRDSEIAKSLNSDYLSQLFILGSSRRLDTGLVKTFLEEEAWMVAEQDALRRTTILSASTSEGKSLALSSDWSVSSDDEDGTVPTDIGRNSSATGASSEGRQLEGSDESQGTDDLSGYRAESGAPSGSDLLRDRFRDLPPEARGLLVFKRGHSQEFQRGRLFLPKLDFLQSLLVRSVGSTIGAVISGIGGAVKNAWQDASDRVGQQMQDGPEEPSAPESAPAAATTATATSNVNVNTRVLPINSNSGSGGGLLARMSVLDSGSGYEREAQRDAREGVEEDAVVDSLLVRTQLAAAMLRDTFLSWGIPPRLAAAGSSIAASLSEVGLVPRLDVLPLAEVELKYPVLEPPETRPKFLRKISLGDVIGQDLGSPGNIFRMLFRDVELQEPAFKEVLVAYRQAPSPPGATILKEQLRKGIAGLNPMSWWGGAKAKETVQIQERLPVQIRIYRDIPLPSWKLVLPDKLLQFRPLDLVRTDIFAISGLAALVFQVNPYQSTILDIVTVTSAGILIFRIILGYQRMADRFRSYVNEVLQERTVASQEGALDYLATSAALQQFKQAALAWLLLLNRTRWGSTRASTMDDRLQSDSTDLGDDEPSRGDGRGGSRQSDTLGEISSLSPNGSVSVSELGLEAARLLRLRSGVQVRFDAEEAVSELVRLGLVTLNAPAPASVPAAEIIKGTASGIGGNARVGREGGSGSPNIPAGPQPGTTPLPHTMTLASALVVKVASASEAIRVVQGHWDTLLWSRVDAILREFE